MYVAPFPLFLTIVSGLCWTLVYIEGIRVGIRDRSFSIPFWALALNFAWEVLHTYFGYRESDLPIQTLINGVWALFDVGILYTYLRYGLKYFPGGLRPHWFYIWSGLGLVTAFAVQYAFVMEFGVMVGRAYAAFPQNLLMSVLFIGMLAQRGSSEGQSLAIAVGKWVGTLAPTILFGLVGGKGFDGPNSFLLTIGLLCSVFDVLYLVLLIRVRAAERRGESGASLLASALASKPDS